MKYLGDFKTSANVYFKFTTQAATGAAVAPSDAFEAADIRIYKDGSATERTSSSGITMTSPFDSITGLHHVTIDLSDNADAGFYAAGHDYTVVLSPDTETVDGKTVVAVLAHFSIENRCVNWAQVVSPTTTVGLTGTTISSSQKVDIETIKTNPVVNGGTITFPTNATLASTTNIVLAKGAGVTGFNDLDAAGIRGAVGLASANLDTQLGSIGTLIGGLNDLSGADVRTALGMAAADLDDQLDAIIAAIGSIAGGFTSDDRTQLFSLLTKKLFIALK